MARHRTNKRKERALDTMKEKGVGLCALGVGALLLPLFMGKSQVLAPLAYALRPLGWMVLLIGVVLLGIHQFAKAKTAQALPLPPPTPYSPRPAERKVLRDIRDDILSEGREPEMAQPQPGQVETSWGQAVFAAIEWRRFEAVCETLFGQAGFETQSQSHGADGGVDIWLHSRNAEGPVAVVQCKHWQGKAVGVKELREFFGVMASHKLTRGTYATTSSYTADAAAFAKANGINALDGKGLLALIAKRSSEQQKALLDVAYEGEYWRPTCASCGTKLVERTPSKGGARFWGCSGYPRCKSRLPMVAALR
jgi:restriction system protein